MRRDPSPETMDGAAASVQRPGFGEFVALMALMMSMVAFSIDAVMPAFGPIARDFPLDEPNDIQFVIYAFMAGFGVMQIVFGPLADWLGRRPLMLAGLAVYLIGTVLALAAPSFDLLLVARAAQGMGAAATRVLIVTIVRDRFEGREMARVMSLIMMIFITVPIVAPGMGSLILAVGPWQLIVVAMLALALALAVWFALRMPETLKPAYRKRVSLGSFGRDIARILRSRIAFGYTSAMLLMQGCIMIYIGMAAQVFETDVYPLGPIGFPLVFAGLGLMMGLASFANSRLVTRFGMRRMSHGGLIGFVAVTGLMLAVALAFDGRPPLSLLLPPLAVSHFLFSITMPNFNTMAMEELGDIAGTASSFIGCYTAVGSALVGALVSQRFDATVIPLTAGYFALGALCLAVVLSTEGGRLFRARHSG